MKSARALNPPLRLLKPDEQPPPLALDDVYRTYCRYVGAVILRVCGQRVELDDLIQDVFVEAAAGLGRLKQPDAIRGWLSTITVRVVRRHLRRRRFYRFLGLASEHDTEQIADAALSPMDRSLLASVYRALDALAVDDRIAYVLHHVEGETLDTVAELCGCSRTTVKRRVLRARLALEKRLGDG